MAMCKNDEWLAHQKNKFFIAGKRFIFIHLALKKSLNPRIMAVVDGSIL